MKILDKLRSFFEPSDDAPRWKRFLPYVVLGILTVALLVGVNWGWTYTNSSEFCGTACHTMPPEYSTYQVSPHARIQCVECHIGRDVISQQFLRKAGDLRHVYLNITQDFEYPIKATRMRPSEDVCETCHYPEKFSDDSLREIVNYGLDEENTLQKIILIMKTGGGTSREGLGYGIHWHVENQVDFYATDFDQQDIPYIRVVDEDGEMKEFFDITSDFDAGDIVEDELIRMDCIACHNRITHNIPKPEEIVSLAMNNNLIPTDLPFAAKQAVEALYVLDEDKDVGLEQLASFAEYYEENYPEIYQERSEEINAVVEVLRVAYNQYVFPDQEYFWDTYSNNLGHKEDAGCFRCHDGQHFTSELETIRLECNICHSIPVVMNEGDLVTYIELASGPEPESHTDPIWISIHGRISNSSCEACHDVGSLDLSVQGAIEKPQVEDSFCGNEACHGSDWSFIGFGEPIVQEVLETQIEKYIIDTPEVGEGDTVTYENTISFYFEQKCVACHNSSLSSGGLDLSSYETALDGVVAGDVDSSVIVERQTMDSDHYGQLSEEEVEILIQWIADGGLEK